MDKKVISPVEGAQLVYRKSYTDIVRTSQVTSEMDQIKSELKALRCLVVDLKQSLQMVLD